MRERLAAGDGAAAAEAIVLGFGPEILGWLRVSVGDEHEAADVFSAFSEEVCRCVGRFRGDSSARTWAYAVARNCQRRLWAAPRRRREAPLTPSLASRLEIRVRTETLPYLRTEAKDRLEAIRDSMSAEDRSLLVLRLDRGLAWEEIARVLAEDGADEAEGVRRRAAALRKRFQRLKEVLRERARAEGLVE